MLDSMQHGTTYSLWSPQNERSQNAPSQSAPSLSARLQSVDMRSTASIEHASDSSVGALRWKQRVSGRT